MARKYCRDRQVYEVRKARREREALLTLVVKPATVQCEDSGWGEYFVRVIYTDGEIGDDRTYPDRKKAEWAAANFAKRHNVSWETNY